MPPIQALSVDLQPIMLSLCYGCFPRQQWNILACTWYFWSSSGILVITRYFGHHGILVIIRYLGYYQVFCWSSHGILVITWYFGHNLIFWSSQYFGYHPVFWSSHNSLVLPVSYTPYYFGITWFSSLTISHCTWPVFFTTLCCANVC